LSKSLVCREFAQSLCWSPMKTLKVRQRSFQKLTQFTMLNKVQDPLACKVNLLLQELQCFSHSLEWGDSAQRWCCSCRKTVRSRQNSFKEQNEFTTLTMLLDPLFSNITDSLTNLQFFSHLLLCGDFAQSWRSSTMKTLTVAQRSFQKLAQFTMLNKLQEPLACNINASLTRAAVLLPFTWMGRFSRKLMLLIQENTEKYSVLL
jgi:hypothetical protein